MSELTNGLVPQLQERIKQLEFQLQAKEAYTKSLIETMQVAVDTLNSHFRRVDDVTALLEKTVSRHKLTISKPSQPPAAAPVADAPVQEAPAPRFKVGDKVRSKSQRYEDGEYDVISRANGFGEFVLHGTYLTTCFEGELEAYSESEGE